MTTARSRDTRLAWALVLPAVMTILVIALFPLAWTAWESLHLHDLRMPWRGRPLVGFANYAEVLGDQRFWGAIGHTAFFTASSVTLELCLGLLVALALNETFRGRAVVRTAVLIPWAVPTVVAGLVWRFMFDTESGIANLALLRSGLVESPVAWLVHPTAAWVPVVLADVWKTTPFVALLLLAALQTIDRELYQAAMVDGAGPLERLRHVTLPQIKPALLVVLLFRTLDAFRVFDLVYVLTAGGPGTSTEPVALYTFAALLQHLRFGYGSALAVVVFAIAFGLALAYVRGLDVGVAEDDE